MTNPQANHRPLPQATINTLNIINLPPQLHILLINHLLPNPLYRAPLLTNLPHSSQRR